MQIKYKVLFVILLPLFESACQRNTQIFIAKGKDCNYAGYNKWKVKITVNKDSTFYILTSNKSFLTNWKKEERHESGNWLLEKDTLDIYSKILERKLALIDKRYLCNSADIKNMKKMNKEKIDFIKNYLAYHKRRF